MNQDLTEGKPEKVLRQFCLPLFGSVIFQQLYNIADSLVAGKECGGEAAAGGGGGRGVLGGFFVCCFGGGYCFFFFSVASAGGGCG